MFISTAWAQDAAAGGGMAVLFSYLPIILIIVVFYFLLLRPQNQAAQKRKLMLEALQVGDTVVLLAGMVGIVRRIHETQKLLEIEVLPSSDRVWVERAAVERLWDNKVALPKVATDPVKKKR